MTLTTKQLADFISWLRKSPIWLDDGILKLYLHCLEKASHNHYDWRGLHLQPGDLPLSEVNTAQALNWSRDKLRKRIRLLEATGFVSLNTTPGVGTVLHIAGWPQNDTGDATDSNKTKQVLSQNDTDDATGGYKTKLALLQNDTDDATGSNKMKQALLQNDAGDATGSNKMKQALLQNDTGSSTDSYKMKQALSQNDTDSTDDSKMKPALLQNDTNPQTPICHDCQQNHTGSCESGPLITQEQPSDQTGRRC